VSRYGVLRGGGERDTGPPAWLRALAGRPDLARFRWGLVAKGDYSSRKILLFLFEPTGGGAGTGTDEPALVVKLTRSPEFNARLENEAQALEHLRARGPLVADAVPAVAFHGRHAELAAVSETAVRGEPFAKHTSGRADCPHTRAAIEWLTVLAEATALPRAASGRQVAETLTELLQRFCRLYRTKNGEREFLAGQIERVANASRPFPLVFQHGDPGTWNLLVSPGEGVRFLDWEAAEPNGMPLWDLFYLVRSFAIACARERGTRESLAAFDATLASGGPLSELLRSATSAYCDRIGLDPALVEPLFHTCWMHRALKEATRLTGARVEKGTYVSLLRFGIENRERPALRRLFSGGRGGDS
jgi:aminoglycoside phosphotransferase (APT) family kinase protein